MAIMHTFEARHSERQQSVHMPLWVAASTKSTSSATADWVSMSAVRPCTTAMPTMLAPRKSEGVVAWQSNRVPEAGVCCRPAKVCTL